MNVIQFPKKKIPWHGREVVYDHLMNVAQTTLDSIADQVHEVAADSKELREQLIFVLEKLADIAEDLKTAEAEVL